jgi:hypothetical protein
MPLTWVLRLYADIYHGTFRSFGTREERAFVELLRQRYHHMRQVVAAHAAVSNTGAGDRPEGTDAGPKKCELGGLIVLRTAQAWQGHHAPFPCRLVENL